MGYMKHHTIIVTGWSDDSVAEANIKARHLFKSAQPESLPDLVSPVISSSMNGYRSFFIAPDGSKEGWAHSESGDSARGQFVAWLREARERGVWLDWVELSYGGDDHTPLIESHEDSGDE